MKNLFLYIVFSIILLSCDQNFKELNRDPNVVDAPPLESVFTYVEKKLADYKGSEWYYDNHQIMPWMQYLVLGEANSGDVNQVQPRGGKYSVFYNQILPHLVEIRRQIDTKTAEEQEYYKKFRAVTYVVQVFHAMLVTDLFGSIPYKEAGIARLEGKINPVYDSQVELFDQFHAELNTAIQDLTDNQGQYFNPGSADFIYQGDWDKWIKLTNAIKLRLAARLESQDLEKAKTIINEVVADGRLFEKESDQFVYDISDEWRGTGGASLEWKGVLWASGPVVEFMKQTIDPRIRIFYEPNGYHEETIAAYKGNDLPPVIDTANDNQLLYTASNGEKIYGYRYIGAPVNRNAPNLNKYSFTYNPNAVGSQAVQLSKWNQRLLMNCGKKYSGGPQAEGSYVDVLLSYAEVCFLMSEFILKDYTSGNANEWYEKGIRASMATYDMIAQEAQLGPVVAGEFYPYQPISETEIANYLAKPEIQFDGANDLEKVYIQQYLNFYRQPTEGYTMGRRTGYPKFNSELLARGKVDNPILPWPRRMVTPDPGDLNRANWRKSHEEQGFSGLDESPEVLNSQRLWWDLKNPALGEGE